MKMRNKKIRSIILCIFLFVGALVFTKFPSTYSYFSHEEDTALVYQSQIYNLYDELSMNLDSATVQTAKFQFSFKPSEVTKKDETDSYEITIPNACTFDKVVGAPSTTVSITSNQSRTISFPKGANRDNDNYVYISCIIDKSSDMVDFTSQVIGKIHEIDHRFLYKKYSYKESYEEYLERVNGTVDSSGPVSPDNLYQKFLTWIDTYATKVGYKEVILEYLTSVYKTEADLKNTAKFNILEGFSISYDKVANKYTFKVLNNFLGYARTYHQSITSFGKYADLYFSTNIKVRLNQALKYYLNEYVYPNSPTSATLVYDYILNNGGIYSVILNGNTITGVQFKEYNSTTLNSTVTLNKSLLLSLALSIREKTPCISISDRDTMLYTNFRNTLSLTASSLGISTDVMKAIYNRSDIASSVTKNNTATTPASFTDYFAHQDGNRYLILKVSSDITKDPLYNKVSFTSIALPSDMIVTFTNINNNLKIHISHKNKSDVLGAITHLNGYFGTSITEANVTVLADTANEYTIEYTIAK